MGEWQARLLALRARFDALPLGVRIGTLALAIGGLGYLAISTFMDSHPSMGVLFSNLEDDDAARIVERLRAANVPYKLAGSGTTILVPESKVYETRLMLAGEGLPNGGGVGFEVFDTQRFGESEFAEQVKYHRALEGELARTISHLSGVQSARVHLVLPSRALFSTEQQGASASVVLHLKPGFRVRNDQVKGIIHLVASSVRDLDPQNVTLVDGNGKRLGGAGGDLDVGSDADAYQRQVERSKERAAQQLLDTTLGPGKALVRVAATMTFAHEEWTEERYDPDSTATRSFQINEESNGSGSNTVGGVPGAPSNLPGGQAPTTTTTGKGLTRRSETRNYEISKTLRRGVEPVGRVTKLQAAVVVDGKWSGSGSKRKFTPLPKQDLDRISAIVTSAIGADQKRGDTVVVECVPFANSPVAEGTDSQRNPLLSSPYIKYAAIGLGALLLLGLVLGIRKLRRPSAEPPAALPGTVESKALEEGEAGTNAEEATRLLNASEHIGQAADASGTIPEETSDQLRQLASDLASREPDAAARIIRGWLAEGGNP